jgi:hypothetical protein
LRDWTTGNTKVIRKLILTMVGFGCRRFCAAKASAFTKSQQLSTSASQQEEYKRSQLRKRKKRAFTQKQRRKDTI